MTQQISIIDELIRHASRNALPSETRAAVRMSTNDLLTDISHSPAVRMQLLSRTPRFFIDAPVVDAIRKMFVRAATDVTYLKRTTDIITQKPDLIRPPFISSWFEYDWANSVTKDKIRIGFKIDDLEKMLQLKNVQQRLTQLPSPELPILAQLAHMAAKEMAQKMFVRSEFFTRSHDHLSPDYAKGQNPFYIYTEKGGKTWFHDGKGEYGQKAPAEYSAKHLLVMTTLMMLHSRTPVLKVEPAEISPFQRSRFRAALKAGKPTQRPFNILKFDLSKFLSSGASHDEAASQMEQHIVMGHFKLRETGIYWWSPHWRGGTEEQKEARKTDAPFKSRFTDVFAMRPESILVPGDIGWPQAARS